MVNRSILLAFSLSFPLFVMPSFSQPNDGEYLSYEESIFIKRGRVVKCDGSNFGAGRDVKGSCRGWKFFHISDRVIEGKKIVESFNLYFCKLPAPIVNYPPYSAECTKAGWLVPKKKI